MSNPISLHCPHCGTKLKIKNRSLFGQSVNCPGCQKKFVLRDPNEDVPVTAEAKPAPVAPAGPAFPDFSKLDSPGFDDNVPPLFAGAPPAPAKTAGSPSPAFPSPFIESEKTGTPVTPFPPTAGPIPGLQAGGQGLPGALPPLEPEDPLAAIRKKRNKGKWFNYATFAVVLLAGIGFGWHYSTLKKAEPQAGSLASGRTANKPSAETVLDPSQPYSKMMLEADPARIAEFRPTHGKPVELLMMPSGINMLFHLRPAELWSDSYHNKVLRASLTDDVMRWLGDQIKGLTRRDPAQIEELTVGVLLGARGMMPNYCAVVRLSQPEKLSALIEEFPGKYLYDITERPNLRLKVDDQHGYLIHDERTFAICPASSAGDLEYSITTPNHDISVGMSEILARTDRLRLFTAIADVNDIAIHLKNLLPPPAQPFFRELADWFGEDVETVGWSVHPEPYFHSELSVRPVTTIDARQLESEMNVRLATLPDTVWKDLCLKMRPREMRFRQLIGRLPAMLKAFQEATVSQREQQTVVFTTVLPAKAAPNLALATLFTIDEAERTNFQQAVASTQGAKPKLPDSVVGRMKVIVDAEFARTPLEQALTYLCGEAQVNLEIEGDALKNAGYTKNMPQTFNLGKVPMERALAKIVNAYQEKDKEMAISIDEKTKTIKVLTKKYAEEKGLAIHPLKNED